MTRSKLGSISAATTAIATLVLVGCAAASAGRAIPSTASRSTASLPGQPTSASRGPAASPAATESNPPGDIPDNQAFVPYAPATGGFTVKVPEGWAQTTTGTSTVFTDKLNSVRVEMSSSATAPTVASVNATDVPALKATTAQFALKSVTTFHRAGGSGVLTIYLADSAPDPVTNKVVRDSVERYTFWQGGHLVVLDLIGPQTADNVDPWRKVSDSFRWTP